MNVCVWELCVCKGVGKVRCRSRLPLLSLLSGFLPPSHPKLTKIRNFWTSQNLEGILEAIQVQCAHAAGMTWRGGSSCKNIEVATALSPSSVPPQPGSWATAYLSLDSGPCLGGGHPDFSVLIASGFGIFTVLC